MGGISVGQNAGGPYLAMPIIEQRLDSRANGKPRHKGSFKLHEERHVTFSDAKNCILTVNGRVCLTNNAAERALDLRWGENLGSLPVPNAVSIAPRR
jgi:hypothetical protein